MKLSMKLKRFSQFCSPFLESSSNLEHSQKKDDISSTLRQSTYQSVPNAYEIFITAPFSYFLLPVSKIYLEKISITDILTLMSLC